MRLNNKQFLHKIRTIQEEPSPQSGSIEKDVSKLLSPFCVQRQRITCCEGEISDEESSLRTGGTLAESCHNPTNADRPSRLISESRCSPKLRLEFDRNFLTNIRRRREDGQSK